MFIPLLKTEKLNLILLWKRITQFSITDVTIGKQQGKNPQIFDYFKMFTKYVYYLYSSNRVELKKLQDNDCVIV